MSRRKRARGMAQQAPEIDQALPSERPKCEVAPAAAVCILLIVITVVAFRGCLSCGFVNLDDDVYVTGNARVQRGVTWENVRWAFTTTYFGFYCPMTWLSHMLDCQLYGLKAGGHHLTSLILHGMNTVLLFVLLFRMTGALWRCALVAGLFAIHPLHVESVAWIAERKDVLSTLFWLLTLLAWLGYVKKRSLGWYALALALFALGLMAKSMLVTLPFVLLLLDYWPLGRIETGEEGWPRVRGRLLVEKAPFVALSAVWCIVTFIAQKRADTVQPIEDYPLAGRAANAVVSYVSYLGQMIWPTKLAAFYPYVHRSLLTWLVFGSILVLATGTCLALALARRARYFAIGWFWYLGVLVPVIGLVQVGAQARADRYTYVSLIGIFLIIAWGLADLCREKAAAIWASTAMLSGCMAVLLIVTKIQVGYWADSATLLNRALAVTSNNNLAHNNLGWLLMEEGNIPEAIDQLTEAVRIAPRFPLALNNLGVALARMGRMTEAIERFQQALQVSPDYADAHNNLGIALAATGKPDGALEHYQKAIELNPRHPDAHYNLANLLANAARNDEALEQYAEGLQISPENPKALNNFALLLMKTGRLPEAIERLRRAVQISPDFAEARNNLGVALRKNGRNSEAIQQFQEAVRARPDYATAHVNLGVALATDKRYSEALEHFQEAVRIDPQLESARENLEKVQQILQEQQRRADTP